MKIAKRYTYLNKPFILAISAALLVSFVAGIMKYQQQRRCFFAITMSIKNSCPFPMAQLFFDTGKGYSQKETGILPVTSNGLKQKLSFELPRTEIKSFRFDPINCGGTFSIYQTDIISNTGEIIKSFNSHSYKPANQISIIKTEKKDTTYMVAEGNVDPQIILIPVPELNAVHSVSPGAALLFATRLFFIMGLTFFLLLRITASFLKEK